MNNNFDIVLDTNPMAESVDTVSNSVMGVTTAVVAMQNAVISAEKAASKKICENVDLGFYILMSSQLSQKMALCSSQISSHLLKMQKFRSDILAVQMAMQHDYERISARYFKLFNGLDKNLESRIKALDADAVKISKIKNDFLLQTRDDSTSCLLISSDAQVTSQKAIIAKVKTKTARAIDVLGQEVLSSLNYKEKVEHNLIDERLEAECTKYIPTIICESESIALQGDFLKNISIPEMEGLYSFNDIKNAVENTEFEWKDSSEKSVSKVRAFFEEMAKNESLDERVQAEMMRLFASNTWQETTEK